MNISDRFKGACLFINKKMLWVISIPILMDLLELIVWGKAFDTVYYPADKFFTIKIGFPSAPPSVNYLLEDFPNFLFKYDTQGLTGIINQISFFNVSLLITAILIFSFISSLYMNIINRDNLQNWNIKDFLIEGNKLWYKFFFLDLLIWIVIVLAVFLPYLIVLVMLLMIPLVYVEYSFVADDVGIFENFKLGISFLFNNLGLSIKMALFFGLIYTFSSIIVFQLARFGTVGVVIDIIICAYFGVASNKVILDVYKEEMQSSIEV